MENQTHFDFKFYDFEKKLKNKPFLRQPFGDKWEEYTWKETGQMARKLANGLKSLGLKPNAHIGLISKNLFVKFFIVFIYSINEAWNI